MEIELTPTDSDLSVSVSIERIHEELGNQGILGEDVSREDATHFYLSALALETIDDEECDINEVLMEFIRNSSELDVSKDAAQRIEDLLR